MKRRDLIKTAGAGAVVAGAAGFPAPAISRNMKRWDFLSFWPTGLPGVHDELVAFTEMVKRASGGRLELRLHGAGEMVDAMETMDAVERGAAQIGHGSPYFWRGKVPASVFLSGMPFGMTTQEMNAWYRYGEGQKLADEVYADMNCKVFVGGNTGVQMGGWYNQKINDMDDLQGLRIRAPGLGAEVLKAAGCNVMTVPGAEALTALQTGHIDAAIWVGPYNDLAAGLYRAAQYYYYPGWQEPSTMLDLFVNKDAWDELDSDLQAILEQAAATLNELLLSGYIARNNAALNELIEDHGVDVRRLSDPVLTGLGRLSTEVISEIASEDPLSRKVFDSIIKFRRQAMAWSELSERAFMDARSLDIGEFS